MAVAMWGCGQFDCGPAAAADELAMPYICAIEGGEPRLYPGLETKYKIFGRREEQPFVTCARGAAARCETMMVHRFSVVCDGVRMAWSRMADAGRGAGVMLPANLPSGFAPVSALAGRIVLPSLTPANGAIAKVATQDLSPDSVVDASDRNFQPIEAMWTTTVKADLTPGADDGAVQVAFWIGALSMALLAASLVAAGRWRLPAFAFDGIGDAFQFARSRAGGDARWSYRASIERFREWSGSWFEDDSSPGIHALFNASLIIHSKLAGAELALTALAPDLLLREVLQTEIEQVRQRTADADRRIRSRSHDKSAATFRALSRDLDRISRIAQGATGEQPRPVYDVYDAPQSQTEAYRILGLNADAPPAAVKKLVDALRMTWHPDHARDEPDRQRREARMKQINAAWDLVRETRRAA